jgi:hypothetical protein
MTRAALERLAAEAAREAAREAGGSGGPRSRRSAQARLSDAVCWFALYATFMSSRARARGYSRECGGGPAAALAEHARTRVCRTRGGGSARLSHCCTKLHQFALNTTIITNLTSN